MKINRTMTIETNEIQIGDRIQVGHYTATCQALPGEGLALFLLDQYLDKAMQMNGKNTNKGGYQESDLREELNSEKILKDFTSLELAPFDNGDLLRLPFYGEMFGHDDWYDSGAMEPDDCEQWPLMKERANRRRRAQGRELRMGMAPEQVRPVGDEFLRCRRRGLCRRRGASNSLGVRPAFLIKLS